MSLIRLPAPAEKAIFVMNGKRAVIFVNGDLPDPAAAAGLFRKDDFLVAADGGLRHALSLGLTPHLLIGDLDSVSPQDVAEMRNRSVSIHKFSPAKDETDLELALQAALDEGCQQVILIAALGSRIDHTLGNLCLLTSPAFRDVDVRLDDGRIEAFVIRETGTVQGQPGDLVSLLPVEFEVQGITTEGLAYPLRGETLMRHQGRGISNVMLEKTAKIRVVEGMLYCIHIRQ
ncbi:MAG: thiamine diphosphokinase [Anaerolineaceae bacterium]|jgi:thiamine pyrophosphokinase|nr:thiamine diphosphokinase [Anaerolineaceae bacterium]